MEKQVFELRGHHIRHLKDYLITKNYNFLATLVTEDILFKYGQDFFNNRKNVLDRISKENSLVKIIAKHDSLCDKCNFKVEGGCIIDNIFYNDKETSRKDVEDIRLFKLELDKIYSGKDIANLLIGQ